MRNKNAPQFERDVIDVTIDRAQAEGDVITTLTAQDRDAIAPFNVITYSLVGDGNAPQFFEVETQTGRVLLRSSVAQQADLQYTVRAHRATSVSIVCSFT